MLLHAKMSDMDARKWGTLRINCPTCGRQRKQRIVLNCNLCEVFLRPRARTCWRLVWIAVAVYAVGMTAAFIVSQQ